MKRLLRKATEVDINQPETMNNMVELNELDEADVRHDRCPKCKNLNLSRQDGFKKCERCGSTFKILDGDGFVIA